MGDHVDAFAAKVDAFHFEARALLFCCVAVKFDFAACAQDTVPGEYVGWVGAQEAGYRSVVEGIAGGCSDSTVGADPAAGDGQDDAAEGCVAQLVGGGAVAQDSSLELPGGQGEGHARRRRLAGHGFGLVCKVRHRRFRRGCRRR